MTTPTTSEALRGGLLYFDCFSGISGDMTVAALLDLGVPEEVVHEELKKLPLAPYRFHRSRVKRGALMGTKVDVIVESDHNHDHDHGHGHGHSHGHGHDHGHAPHHHYRQIRSLLQSSLSPDVLTRALAIFDRIATVESHLHGIPIPEVAFHEVGAIDSIVDIVATSAALAWLRPSAIVARRVCLGGGTVMTAHGLLPVPTPATLELLRGSEVEGGGTEELTTPTGAAIIAATVQHFSPLPPIALAGVGWGAGTRELADRPNLLRVVVGRELGESTDSDDLVLIETNIDDMNPELCEVVIDALLAAGALDAWLQPIVMKKGRSALMVSALCSEAVRTVVSEVLLRESTSIGVRYRTVSRTVLDRQIVEVDTPYGRISLKVAGRGAETMNVAPEFESCRCAAREHGVSVKSVYLAALGEFYRLKR